MSGCEPYVCGSPNLPNLPTAMAANRQVVIYRVDVCSVANVDIASALNVGDTFNGVVLTEAHVVLLTDQTDAKENGPYVPGVTPRRAYAFDEFNDIANAMFLVKAGTTDANTLWHCTSAAGGVVGTNNLVFAKIAP